MTLSCSESLEVNSRNTAFVRSYVRMKSPDRRSDIAQMRMSPSTLVIGLGGLPSFRECLPNTRVEIRCGNSARPAPRISRLCFQNKSGVRPFTLSSVKQQMYMGRTSPYSRARDHLPSPVCKKNRQTSFLSRIQFVSMPIHRLLEGTLGLFQGEMGKLWSSE
jgi:hypothetical protein